MVIISAAARGQTRFRLNRKLARTERPECASAEEEKDERKQSQAAAEQFSLLLRSFDKGDTMPVICAATGCNNKFVKGSEIRFYR